MDGLEKGRALELDGRACQLLLEILRTKVPDRDVWVFGSRATGKAKPYSDLDLALDGTEALSLALLAELAEAFEESDLPFRVDLVDLVIADTRFGERVRRGGTLIHKKLAVTDNTAGVNLPSGMVPNTHEL